MNISGVILFIIVALWGSLLVPALVRKHDNVTEVRSVDRFSYALRILSRRTPYIPGRRDVLVARKSAAERAPVVSPTPEFVARRAAPPRHGRCRPRRDRVAANRSAAGPQAPSRVARPDPRAGPHRVPRRARRRPLVADRRHQRGAHGHVRHPPAHRGRSSSQTIERRRAQARRRAGRRELAEQPRRRHPADGRARRRRYDASAEHVRAGRRHARRQLGTRAGHPADLRQQAGRQPARRSPRRPAAGSTAWSPSSRRPGSPSGGDLYDQMNDERTRRRPRAGPGRRRAVRHLRPDGLDDIIERRRAVND